MNASGHLAKNLNADAEQEDEDSPNYQVYKKVRLISETSSLPTIHRSALH